MKEINIIGLSGPMISMILDNLASNEHYPKIFILNNLNLNELDFNKFSNFNVTYIRYLKEFKHYENFILGVNKPHFKLEIVNKLNLKSDNFLKLIHKNTSVSTTSYISNGVFINSQVSIAHHSIIDEFVTINRNSSVGHDTIIGSYKTINPGANIAGFVKIGKRCQIGMGVNVMDNITIGENTVIGAGSLVTKNLPSNVVAYGNPCKIIRNNE